MASTTTTETKMTLVSKIHRTINAAIMPPEVKGKTVQHKVLHYYERVEDHCKFVEIHTFADEAEALAAFEHIS
jgi:adenosylmethionine-8-amino-7-oxononanoate aminotransferase